MLSIELFWVKIKEEYKIHFIFWVYLKLLPKC